MDSKERFSGRADDYARARPSYPAEIIDAILDGFNSPTVADLGAGTGISSLILASAGANVLAVEPNAKMRAEIPVHDHVRPIDGSAENTTLPNACVDIVTAFQAYHWFEPATFFVELNRIAKPRARFAAVWNHRDRSDDFTGAYEAIVDAYDESDGRVDADRRKGVNASDLAAAGWPNPRIVEARHAKPFDWNLMVAYVRSVSYIPQSGEAYDAMLQEFGALFDERAEKGIVQFKYVTLAFLADR